MECCNERCYRMFFATVYLMLILLYMFNCTTMYVTYGVKEELNKFDELFETLKRDHSFFISVKSDLIKRTFRNLMNNKTNNTNEFVRFLNLN